MNPCLLHWQADSLPRSPELQGFNISPGMTCQVTIRSADGAANEVEIPLTALYTPAQGGTFVWVVGEGDRVELRAVVLGELLGKDMVSIKQGLQRGESVVSAGVYHLREGEQVKILNR